MEERLLKAQQNTTSPQKVDAQAREHALQTMAKDLEAKFVFVMGAASKAKKLPHMSTIRKQRGEGSQPDTTTTLSPTPIDMLDILQAFSYKLENLRNKIRQIEQVETSTTTTNTTKIVTSVL
jgi:hypothetical protein